MSITESPGPARTRAAVTLAAMLGLSAVAWVVTVRRMSGMDMGVAIRLGSLGAFIAAWVPMMAAMMLPGAVPAILARAAGARAAVSFVAAYLAVWAVVGVAVHALYRPHGTLAAGVAVIAAGVYECTPLKRHFRRACRDRPRSGFEFGLHCVGSSIGLTLMLMALGVMNIAWMLVIGVVAGTQKLLPPRAVVDVPLALAIVWLGVLILAAPAAVPGLMPAM